MTEEFLPFIDNWATNDITATGMKIFSRNTSAVRGFVERWLKSDKAYTARFGIVCLLSYFLGEAFEESDLNLLASLNVKNEYYVDMAAAWYISVALVKDINTQSGWRSQRVMISFFRTSGSPPV